MNKDPLHRELMGMPKECEHEYRSFVDRVENTKDIHCWKCGKEAPYPHSGKIT